MDTELLIEKFGRMGARVKATEVRRQADRVSVDIGRDRKGEFFDLRVRAGEAAVEPKVCVDVIDVRPRERHLLLSVCDADRRSGVLPEVGAAKQKFLCGHDERAWFVAAVPERRGASNVREAMEALKPFEAGRAQSQARVRFKDRNRRHNAGFVRQGEWFFVPEPRARVPEWLVLRDEPLVRTGGKPHRAEFAFRSGGELVYVHEKSGRVLSRREYRLVAAKPGGLFGYEARRRDVNVLVRGRISHPDHKTIVLDGWHAVHMNTESQSEARRFVAFID